MSAGGQPSVVFLDRDGTIIHDREYLSRPDQVELLPGAAAAIRRLNDAKVPVIVITNQSGIARGLFSEEDFGRVTAHLDGLLAQAGASVRTTYHCPHLPSVTGPCTCRKPGTELFQRALHDLHLSPARALYVGDRLRDIEPARALGGRGVLVWGPRTPDTEVEEARRTASVAESLGVVVEEALA